ncbi:hypothetical protein FRB95_008334 [Tulasnella sp. JGI-2019a]|nr:hypothetical protein FRB95_008334 [Tulasnella sp. JGI-2019a]
MLCFPFRCFHLAALLVIAASPYQSRPTPRRNPVVTGPVEPHSNVNLSEASDDPLVPPFPDGLDVIDSLFSPIGQWFNDAYSHNDEDLEPYSHSPHLDSVDDVAPSDVQMGDDDPDGIDPLSGSGTTTKATRRRTNLTPEQRQEIIAF